METEIMGLRDGEREGGETTMFLVPCLGTTMVPLAKGESEERGISG